MFFVVVTAQVLWKRHIVVHRRWSMFKRQCLRNPLSLPTSSATAVLTYHLSDDVTSVHHALLQRLHIARQVHVLRLHFSNSFKVTFFFSIDCPPNALLLDGRCIFTPFYASSQRSGHSNVLSFNQWRCSNEFSWKSNATLVIPKTHQEQALLFVLLQTNG